MWVVRSICPMHIYVCRENWITCGCKIKMRGTGFTRLLESPGFMEWEPWGTWRWCLRVWRVIALQRSGNECFFAYFLFTVFIFKREKLSYKIKVDLLSCSSLSYFVQEGIAITDPRVYRSIAREQLVHILRPDVPGTCMPLIDKRLDSLHTAGTTLCQVHWPLLRYPIFLQVPHMDSGRSTVGTIHLN